MPLKLIPRDGSPHWYIRGTIRGISVYESTGLSDKGQAEDVLLKRGAEILTRSIHGNSASRTFAEAALSYQEKGGDGFHLAPIILHFGKRALASIGQDEIEAAAKKLKPGAGPATINRQIYTPISAVLHHAAKKGWCPKPVIARPTQPGGRVRWIDHAEAERLMAAASPHMKPLVLFLLSTGARLSEALYLDWRQVDLSRGHVSFLETKNGERRGVPLHPRMVAELANLPHKDGAVFRRWLGGPRQDGRVRPVGPGYESRDGRGGGQVKTGWKAMCKRAGITDFTPHDCRHTWATWHYAANHDIGQLMELGGWKTPAMVMRYTHVNTAHLAASIGRLWAAKPTEYVQAGSGEDADAKQQKA